MKNQFFRAGVVSMLFVLIGAASAFAQNSFPIRAKIPFNFFIGKTSMPAGVYDVSRLSLPSRGLIIRSEDGRSSALMLTLPVEAMKAKDEGKLVFKRYATEYFLSQVWAPGVATGHSLPKSDREREQEVLATTREVISIAASKR